MILCSLKSGILYECIITFSILYPWLILIFLHTLASFWDLGTNIIYLLLKIFQWSALGRWTRILSGPEKKKWLVIKWNQFTLDG